MQLTSGWPAMGWSAHGEYTAVAGGFTGPLALFHQLQRKSPTELNGAVNERARMMLPFAWTAAFRRDAEAPGPT